MESSVQYPPRNESTYYHLSPKSHERPRGCNILTRKEEDFDMRECSTTQFTPYIDPLKQDIQSSIPNFPIQYFTPNPTEEERQEAHNSYIRSKKTERSYNRGREFGTSEPVIDFEDTPMSDKVVSTDGRKLYQTITFTLPQPMVGQRVTVSYLGKNYEYQVLYTLSNGIFIDFFTMRGSDGETINVIMKGNKWVIDQPGLKSHEFTFHALK